MFIINEPPRGKPRGIFKGKIHFIAASCGELNPGDFASLLRVIRVIRVICEICGLNFVSSCLGGENILLDKSFANMM
jgi:hypothetical protein